MYEKTDDVQSKYVQDIDTSGDGNGAQTTCARSGARTALNIIALLIEAALLAGAAAVMWMGNLIVTESGTLNILTGETTETFSLLFDFTDILRYVTALFGHVGQGFSDGSALTVFLGALPELLFWSITALTAVVLPLVAAYAVLMAIFGAGRAVTFPRSFSAATSLCLATVLAAGFMGVRDINILSSPIICAMLGMGGVVVSTLARTVQFGRITPLSCVRGMCGIMTICGAALALFAFPELLPGGITPISAILSAIDEPTALSVALSVAVLLCSVLSLITLPIFVCRVCLRSIRGYGKIIGQSGAFLAQSLVTSGAVWAYSRFVLQTNAVGINVYLYAASGIICFVTALIRGNGSAEK